MCLRLLLFLNLFLLFGGMSTAQETQNKYNVLFIASRIHI